MLRPSVLALSLLLFSSPVLGQATPTESPTLQALLAEIRQLRKDLANIRDCGTKSADSHLPVTRTRNGRCPSFATAG